MPATLTFTLTLVLGLLAANAVSAGPIGNPANHLLHARQSAQSQYCKTMDAAIAATFPSGNVAALCTGPNRADIPASYCLNSSHSYQDGQNALNVVQTCDFYDNGNTNAAAACYTQAQCGYTQGPNPTIALNDAGAASTTAPTASRAAIAAPQQTTAASPAVTSSGGLLMPKKAAAAKTTTTKARRATVSKPKPTAPAKTAPKHTSTLPPAVLANFCKKHPTSCLC